MIVINKRYYDYDYDNQTIIMFDADDDDDQINHNQPKQGDPTSHSPASKLESQSQSTETVPDDLIKPSQCSVDNEESDDIKKQSGADHSVFPKNKAMGSICWISSNSPSGSKRIPYAIQTAHSYSINKLEVQLTTLVDVATIEKQKQQRLAAQQRAIHAAMLHAQQRQHEQWARAYAHHHPHAPNPHQPQYHHGPPPPHHGPPGPPQQHPFGAGPPPPKPHRYGTGSGAIAGPPMPSAHGPPPNAMLAPHHHPHGPPPQFAMMPPPDAPYHGYPPHGPPPPVQPMADQYRRRFMKGPNPPRGAYPRHAEDAYFGKQRQRQI